jgi:hypothetical protein
MGHSTAWAIRLQLVEALRRRAASHDGEARRILDERLSKLLATDAGTLHGEPGYVEDADSAAPARGALGTLVDQFASHEADDRLPSFPEMPALDEFQAIWSRLHTASRMRQSLAQVPTDAGPLNSSALVHRSIELMRELSPGYLQHFLSYVDDLSWMARLADSTASTPNDAPRPASIGKRSRKKKSAQR